MSRDEYMAANLDLAYRYTSVRTGCDAMTGNAKAVCVAEVKGRDRIAVAELEATYRPTGKRTEAVASARVNAASGLAKVKCEPLFGDERAGCLKDAKSRQATTNP